jgi:hypothetical protein
MNPYSMNSSDLYFSVIHDKNSTRFLEQNSKPTLLELTVMTIKSKGKFNLEQATKAQRGKV